MPTFRGLDGLVALGGHLTGPVVVNGAVPPGGSTVNFDNGGGAALMGVSAPGDRFTIGATTYTVTNGPHTATGNTLTGVTFTPAATAGLLDNAVVTYALNSLAELRQWTLQPTMQALDTTVCRQTARTYRPGLQGWTGQGQALFDNGDPVQAAIIASLMAGTLASTTATILFGLLEGQPRDFYGAALLSNLQTESPLDDLVTVRFEWQGSDLIHISWA